MSIFTSVLVVLQMFCLQAEALCRHFSLVETHNSVEFEAEELGKQGRLQAELSYTVIGDCLASEQAEQKAAFFELLDQLAVTEVFEY